MRGRSSRVEKPNYVQKVVVSRVLKVIGNHYDLATPPFRQLSSEGPTNSEICSSKKVKVIHRSWLSHKKVGVKVASNIYIYIYPQQGTNRTNQEWK